MLYNYKRMYLRSGGGVKVDSEPFLPLGHVINAKGAELIQTAHTLHL